MWFYWIDKGHSGAIKRVIPCTVIRGADWFIQNDKSYDIVSQTCVPGTKIICIRTESRPTDWIGPLYLETTESPMEIFKEDAKGILFRRKGWMVVHWFGEGEWKDVERWIL
jgi:hypothetical protein